MKDGGFRRASRPISSHLCKPVLNGLSDLLRLPQYPVLGVRAAALTGVRREGELYTRRPGGRKRRAAPPRDGHKSGDRHGLLLDATPPPLLHPASGHSHSWLNRLKKKKEHRHQARTPSIGTYL